MLVYIAYLCYIKISTRRVPQNSYTETDTMRTSTKPIEALLRACGWLTAHRAAVPSECRNFGDVLLQCSLISDEQLQHALRVQQEKLVQLGKAVPLGMVIAELGYASEASLLAAINEHYGLCATSLQDNIKQMVHEKRWRILNRLTPPRMPIWVQLSAATILIIILTMFVLSYNMLGRQRDQLYQQTVRIGMVSLSYFANNARIPLLDDNILSLNTLINNAAEVEGLEYAIITNTANVIKAHSDPKKIGTILTGTMLKKTKRSVTRQGAVSYYSYSSSDGKSILNLSRPISFQDKLLGEVHVGVSIDFIENLIGKEQTSIIVTTLFILMLGIAIAILLGFSFSRPIAKLVVATNEIRKGNYTYKVELHRNDELSNFAKAFNQMSNELWKKTLMEKSFGKYVGPEVLEMIMTHPESPWLKGHKNEATILLADMRNFTTYASHEEPEVVVELLNEYFEIATGVILENDGYIDKFIGDAVLGVFGIPVYHANHTERAVRSALEIQSRLREASTAGNKRLADIGIGIDAGIVVAGNIGSQAKMEYTVIGDSVNMASRLNGFAGPGEVVISKRVCAQLSSIVRAEPLEPQKVKGKAEPVEMFRVLEIKETAHEAASH
ncbi:adenylate/guanylate cyclase domain-containing protein [Thermodesulfobacteriota bacterium]